MKKSLLSIGLALSLFASSVPVQYVFADSVITDEENLEEFEIDNDFSKEQYVSDEYRYITYNRSSFSKYKTRYKWNFKVKDAAEFSVRMYDDFVDADFTNICLMKVGENCDKRVDYDLDIYGDDDSALNGLHKLNAVLSPGNYYIYAEKAMLGEEDFTNNAAHSKEMLHLKMDVYYISPSSSKQNISVKDAWNIKNNKYMKSYFTYDERNLYYNLALSKAQKVYIHSIANLYIQKSSKAYDISVINKKNNKTVCTYTGKYDDQYHGGTVKCIELPKGNYIIKASCGSYATGMRNIGAFDLGVSLTDKKSKITKISVESAKADKNWIKLKGKKGEKVRIYLDICRNDYFDGKFDKKGRATVKTGYLRKGMTIRIFSINSKGMIYSVKNYKIK